ncbi:MAG: FAD-binding oxidoreductase, partial [Pseudomonadota bacterium]
VTGAFAALALTEAGADVTVVDAFGPAAMASGWTLACVRQSGRHSAELPLARAAVALWPNLSERLGAPTHYCQGGNLRLARNETEARVIKHLVDEQRAAGLSLDFIEDRSTLTDLAPALSEDILAASHCPTDGHADPIATVTAVLAAAERAGASVKSGIRVTGFSSEGARIVAAHTRVGEITCGAVLLACGVHTNTLLEPLGLAIPLRFPIVTVVQTVPRPPLIRQVLGTASANLALRQEKGGSLRFTGGAEEGAGVLDESGTRPRVHPKADRIAAVIERAKAAVPAAGDTPVRAIWGGVLDLTPDALPVIDRVPSHDNMVVAAGFSGHGFGIAPVTGPLAADTVLGNPTAHDLTAFRFSRFNHVAASEPATLHG